MVHYFDKGETYRAEEIGNEICTRESQASYYAIFTSIVEGYLERDLPKIALKVAKMMHENSRGNAFSYVVEYYLKREDANPVEILELARQIPEYARQKKALLQEAERRAAK
ncbi:MAG: hypothetical protein FJZ63_05690 [Chlamydiae bacterium]|nr:hypothetical protein [Chlamydiota bacterium]